MRSLVASTRLTNANDWAHSQKLLAVTDLEAPAMLDLFLSNCCVSEQRDGIADCRHHSLVELGNPIVGDSQSLAFCVKGWVLGITQFGCRTTGPENNGPPLSLPGRPQSFPFPADARLYLARTVRDRHKIVASCPFEPWFPPVPRKKCHLRSDHGLSQSRVCNSRQRCPAKP